MNPLVTTEWLGEWLHDDSIRIADCRFYLADPEQGLAEYRAGHIPTAKYFSLDDDLTGASGPGRHPLPEPADFAHRMQQAGIGDEHTVVVYDSGNGSIAARMWWMLRSLGHPNVTVLDGGWSSWSTEPRSTTSEDPIWDITSLTLAADWSGTITKEEIVATDDLLLIDSRAETRYRGEEEPIDPVAGHIPGAINLPYQGNNLTSGQFLPSDDLEGRFDRIAEAGRTVFYCGSGVTACNNILAATVAGHPGALLYPGSWSDWCTSGGEVATGPTVKSK